jgi:hypothetical protein
LQHVDGVAFIHSTVVLMTLEEGCRNFRVLGDFLMDFKGITAVRYFGVDQNVTLAREIETLGVGCFSACFGLSSLVFERGSKLKRIEAEALSRCLGLQSICLPASVEILCDSCFDGCENLSSLTFEAGSQLTTIEKEAFLGCSRLNSLSIPASVTTIHGLAFAGSEISVISLEEGNATFRFCRGFLINVLATSVVLYRGWDIGIELETAVVLYWGLQGGIELETEFVRPWGLPSRIEWKTGIVPYFGHQTETILNPGLEWTFEFVPRLSRIEAGAFFGCRRLQSISIPASVQSLGKKCFAECDSLDIVTFKSGSRLLRIEAGAFWYCKGLRSISIPAFVESLGKKCFTGCLKLPSVRFESWSKLLRIEASLFSLCTGLRSISIPASVESLGKECFWGCRALSSVQFESGSNLARIYACALGHCGLLKSIVIPGLIQELVKDWAMASALEEVTFESAASLQKMIDRDCVDLSKSFVIKIANCDSDIDSLGSSIGRRFKQFSHLVH